MSYATVTLTGTYLLPDTTPAQGTVEIIPSEKVIVDAAGDVILSGRVKVKLDETGSFSVDLPATDDPNLNPTGFGYTVAAKLHHAHLKAVSFPLPAAVPVVDVADVTTVDPSTFTPGVTYVSAAELTALEGEVDLKANASDVSAALALKANASSLAAKADATRVDTLETLTTSGRLSDSSLTATIGTAIADRATNDQLVSAIQSGTLSPVGSLAFSTTGLTSISNLRPYSVGSDGRVYGRSGAGLTVSRLNPTSTGLDGFLDFSTKAVHSTVGGQIRWATKTEAGYVVVTMVGGSTNKTYMWFSTTWTIAGFGTTPVATIDALANDPLGIPNPARTPDGKTVLIIAPWYGSGGVHNPIPWGSFDGGATWAALTNPRSTTGTGPSNNHWHAALYHHQWERLWLSGGDGVNSYFGYSDDKGVTWHNSPTPTDSPLYDGKTYQQPTMLVGFDDRIAAGPDRGTFPPGVWKIDPLTGKTVRQYSVDPTVATADMQYPLYPHAQDGNVAYIAYPASTSMPVGTRDHTDIIATGDGGRSWHNVGRIAWAGVTTMASNGILGPDPNGYLYMVGPTGLMRAPVLDWEVAA